MNDTEQQFVKVKVILSKFVKTKTCMEFMKTSYLLK